MKNFFTSKMDIVTPDIKEAKNDELIKLKVKPSERKNFVLVFFDIKKNKVKVLMKTKKIDYYVFVNKSHFRKFCELINNMDYFYTKKIKNKQVFFLNEFLGVDDYQTRRFFYNKKNVMFVLRYLEKELGYSLNKYKTVFSKAIRDAHILNKKKYSFKSETDSFFGYLNNNAYKDVFVFRETRRGRKIIVLDINSMYPYLLTLKRYPHPALLEKRKIESLDELEGFPFFTIKASVKIKENLSEKEKEFIRKYHSIEYRINNYTVPVELSENYRITTYFMKEEYDFYKKFLDFKLEDDYIICTKEETGYSSLKELIETYYPKRLKTKRKKKEDERFEILDTVFKNYLVALPSAFSQDSSKTFTKYFLNKEKFKEFIKRKIPLVLRDEEFESKPFQIFSLKKVPMEDKKILKVRYRAFTYKEPDNLIHHHSVMFANARILMMNYFLSFFKEKERFGLELLYSNIDSIHLSINEEKLEEFLMFLKERNLVSEELGKLKIEAIADYGIWFDVGTYYLFDKDYRLVKFANPLPKGKKKPFQIVCAVKDYDEYGYEFYKKYELFKSFRYIKPFEEESFNDNLIKFKRINLNEYSSYEEIQDLVKKNLFYLYPVYKQVFFYFKELNKENKK